MYHKMANFRSKYKCKPLGFGDAGETRFVRIEKHKKWRRDERIQLFNDNRNIFDGSYNTTLESKSSPVIENRLTRMLKWKTERDLRKKLEQTKKRPPFVVGIVHHNLYSPGMKNEHSVPETSTKKVCKSNAPVVATKRVTRATEKRLMQKAQTSKATKVQTKPMHSEKNKQSKVQKEKEYSFAPEDYKFKPPKGLPQLPLFGRVRCSMTPVLSNEFVSSFTKSTRASRRSSTAKFTVEQVQSKILNTSYTIENEQDNDDNTEEGSIVLRLSSDEEEVSLSKSGKENEKSNKKLNDSKRNSKLDNLKENKKINEKLNDSNKNDKKINDSGKKSYITIRNNIKDTHDTIINTSKELQPSTNNNNTPKSLQSDSSNESASFSSPVLSSRGKSNARKEQQIERSFNLDCSVKDNIPTKENIMGNVNISVKEEEGTAQHFEFLLNKEIDRQKKLCEKWSEIKEEPEITEDAQYQINQAIGQTNLLMNKKFQQFRSLISNCATGEGEMLVTCNDLQGFWDMMYMEVENCDSRFEKLEQLRLRNWKEEQVSIVGKPLTKKKIVRKKASSTKSSNIRAFLMKKKQSMAEKAQSEVGTQQFVILNNESLDNKNETNENSLNTKYKLRRSIVLSDKKFTPVKNDKSKLSSLEKVQVSDTKKLKTPLTIMKISKMCKTPEVQLENIVSYINSNQTPAKSILKQSQNCNHIGSSMRAAHKVNFNDSLVSNENAITEELQLKKNLAAALTQIDTLEFECANEGTPIHAERELIFNDSSSEESENTTDANGTLDIIKPTEEKESMQMNVPILKIQTATPFQEPILHGTSNTPLPRGVLRRQNALNETDDSILLSISASTPLKKIPDLVDSNAFKQKLKKNVSMSDTEEITKHGGNIRVLRNRSIATGNTPTHKKFSRSLCTTNEQEFEHKENETPVKSKRKSLRKVNIKDEKVVNSKIDLHDAIAHMSLEETNGRRRSSRRSVKFDEKECSGCVVKLTYPVTPHTRRSRTSIKSKGEV